MGVPGLYGQWIKKRHAYSMKALPNANVSSFSIDLNSVIHGVANEVIPEPTRRNATMTNDIISSMIIEGVKKELFKLLQFYRPQETLVVAVDGVAPIAKENQQQARRFRAAIRNPENLVPFDRNCISPGTQFMIKLDQELRTFFDSNRHVLPPRIMYSSHLVPGEGEHKIMGFFRDRTITNPGHYGQGYHIVYGMDADLVILSMALPYPNLILARNYESEVLFIDELKQGIKEMCNNRESAIDDFVVLSCLVGNDFLPMMKIFSSVADSLDNILRIYNIADVSLTSNGEISTKGLFTFMTYLNTYAPELMGTTKEAHDEFKNQKWNPSFAQPREAGVAEALTALVNTGKTQSEEIFFGTTLQDLMKVVNDYLRTLAWVFVYYKEGTDHVNFEWAYTYHKAPFPDELTVVLNDLAGLDLPIKGHRRFDGMIKFTPLHQLLAIMPRQSKALLPEKMHVLIESTSSPLFYRYVSNFVLDSEGLNETEMHKAIPILPFIDAQEIFSALRQIIWRSIELEPWLDTENVLYDRGVTRPIENIHTIATVATGTVREIPRDRAGHPQFGTRGGRGQRGGRGRGGERGRGGGRGRGSSRQVPFQPPTLPNPFGFQETTGNLIVKR